MNMQTDGHMSCILTDDNMGQVTSDIRAYACMHACRLTDDDMDMYQRTCTLADDVMDWYLRINMHMLIDGQ